MAKDDYNFLVFKILTYLCSLPAFAHAQSWPLLTNPQPFLATSPRETNTSACAKRESVPKGMVQQKSRNIRCGFFWCTIGDSPAG